MAETTQDAATATDSTTTTAQASGSASLDAAAVASGPQASASPGDSSIAATAYMSDEDLFSSTLDLPEPGARRGGRRDTIYHEDAGSFGETAEAAPETATDSQSPAEAAGQETAATAPDAAAEVFDAELLEQARWYGLTDEFAKSFGSSDMLRRALTAIDRRDISVASASQSQQGQQVEGEQQAAQQQAVPQDAAQADAATQAAAQPEVSLAQLTGEIEPFKLELDGWDEDTRKVLEGLNTHYATQLQKLAATAKAPQPLLDAVQQKIDALDQQFQALEQFRLRAEGERIEQEFDGLFSSAGDEYAEVFGKGAGRELGLDSKELQARKELVQEMFALAEADKQFGRKPMTRPQLFKRALAVRFFDKQQDLARKQVQAQVQQRKSQAVAKPTQRRAPPKTGEKAAAEFINGFLKDRGIDLDAPTSDILAEYNT